MKFKNLFVQLFILTPLSALQSLLGILVIMYPIMSYTDCGSSENANTSWLSMLWVGLICLAVLFIVCKIVLRIKGREVDKEYWDPEFVYSGDYDVKTGKVTNLRKEKGGWTWRSTPIVFLMMVLSPAAFVFQLIALLFVLIGLFSRHIFSYYGRVPHEQCRLPFLQAIIHFLFNFVII